jgi:hypothetical protein
VTFFPVAGFELAAQITGRIDIDASSNGTILKLSFPNVNQAQSTYRAGFHTRNGMRY